MEPEISDELQSKLLEGVTYGSTIGIIKRNTSSLGYGSYTFAVINLGGARTDGQLGLSKVSLSALSREVSSKL